MTWSDKQLRAHKKVGANLSMTTATLGIGALGLAGARAGAPRALRAAQKAGHLRHIKPKQVKRFKAKSTGLQTGLLTTSAGVGGIGGFNYAAVQNAEAKRRVMKMDDGMDFGLGHVHQGREEIAKFGLPKMGALKAVAGAAGPKIKTGVSTSIPKIKATGAKVGGKINALPTGAKVGGVLALPAAVGAAEGLHQRKINKAYDPEQKRLRRLDAYNAGANAAAGGMAVGAGVAGHKLGHEIKGAIVHGSSAKRGKTVTLSAAKLKPVGRKGAITAALGLGAVGAAVGADHIRSYGRGNGRSYKPLHGQY